MFYVLPYFSVITELRDDWEDWEVNGLQVQREMCGDGREGVREC